MAGSRCNARAPNSASIVRARARARRPVVLRRPRVAARSGMSDVRRNARRREVVLEPARGAATDLQESTGLFEEMARIGDDFEAALRAHAPLRLRVEID